MPCLRTQHRNNVPILRGEKHDISLKILHKAGFEKQKMFLPHPRVKVSIAGSLRDREVACSASDRQGSNFESCVWRTVSSQLSHHPQEVLLAQFSLYVHKGGLKPDSFHFISRQTIFIKKYCIVQTLHHLACDAIYGLKLNVI